MLELFRRSILTGRQQCHRVTPVLFDAGLADVARHFVLVRRQLVNGGVDDAASILCYVVL